MAGIIGAIVLATAAGIAAERRWPGLAGPRSRDSLIVLLYTVLPVIIFFNVARAEIDLDHAGGIALGWVAVTLAAGAAWLAGSRLAGLGRPQVGALLVCTFVANTGYLGYPMVGILLGFDRIGEAVLYDIGVGVPALLLAGFAVGAAFGDRAGVGVRQRTVAFFTRNPPLFAAAAALAVPDSLAPDVLVDLSRVLVVLLLPVGFFAVGAALQEEAEEGFVAMPPPLERPVMIVIVAKLMLVPAILFAISAPLIELPDPYLLLAAMPAGLNAMLVAHAYGLNIRLTAEAVTWTTLIVIVTATVVSLL